MRTLNLLAAAVLSVWLLSGTASHALVLLNDNFDTENGGIPQLNYFGLANFNVANAGTGGAVDLIGNGSFDFYPGNGLYVDICGSVLPGMQELTRLTLLTSVSVPFLRAFRSHDPRLQQRSRT